MEKEPLIELLIKERDYHASHPHEVTVKFIYGLATSLASVVAGIYFSGISRAALQQLFRGNSVFLIITLFVAGLIVVCIGMAEHAYLHKQQRLRIESAVSYILGKGNAFNYTEFWEQYGQAQFYYLGRRPLKKPTPLFAIEPDTRTYWSFHDRKIELGAIIIFTAYIIIICQAVGA